MVSKKELVLAFLQERFPLTEWECPYGQLIRPKGDGQYWVIYLAPATGSLSPTIIEYLEGELPPGLNRQWHRLDLAEPNSLEVLAAAMVLHGAV